MESLGEQLWRTDRFTIGAPEDFTVTGDGAAVLFRREAALWRLDLATGTEHRLAGPEDVGGPVTGYAEAGHRLVLTADGALWTLTDGRIDRVATGTDPRPDPSGQRIGYRRDGALRLLDATGDRALLTPEHPDVDWGRDGCWWAPDGRALLVARSDDRDVPLWHLADPGDPARPPRAYRYAAVGEPNPAITLAVVTPEGAITAVAAEFEYLVTGGWDAPGPYAAVQTRDQRTVRFLAIDPDTGRADVRHEQTDDRWVQLIPGLPARTASGALLGHADDGATRHLTVAGKPVTPTGTVLRRVLATDGEQVLFTASADPLEEQLWRHHPDTGAAPLTDGAAVHDGTSRGGVLVVVRRDHAHPGPVVAVHRPGHDPVPIAQHVPDPVVTGRGTALVLGPRRLRARLYRPEGASGPLPVLLDPYGGSGMQRVTAELEWRGLVAQWFADHGFAVLVADGAGTPGRGPAWEREVHGDVFGPVLADQVDALHAAAEQHPGLLDLDRVGIRGWSFSGSLALAAVLRRPDVFHVAVAGAGVTEQHLYNAHWRERCLGRPAEHPEWYAAGDLVAEASTLTRPLHLTHGLADDNVHPANSLRFARALRAAGIPHELLVLPGIDHRAFGSARTAELLDVQAEFLLRHLARR